MALLLSFTLIFTELTSFFTLTSFGGDISSTTLLLIPKSISSDKAVAFLSELLLEFILAITLPTSITSLGSANISSITPEAGEGISESTLSVPISKRVSSFSIDSPTFLYHSSIVPSVILSPIFGITTSIII